MEIYSKFLINYFFDRFSITKTEQIIFSIFRLKTFNLTHRQFELYLYLTEKKVRGIRGTSLLPLGNGRLITGKYRKTLMAI